jgi:hypothetical protein
MKHHTPEQMQNIAQVEPFFHLHGMSRRQRLERWADVLEEIPHRHLDTLHETEFQSSDERNELRCDYSPITVAFRDPVLHSAGMNSDTYGEAIRFFEICDEELHDVVCYCRFGTKVSAAAAARQVRVLLSDEPNGLWSSLRALLIG